MDCSEVWARIAVLNGQLQAAEALYLEQNQVEKAIQMYLSLHKWENGNAGQKINMASAMIMYFVLILYVLRFNILIIIVVSKNKIKY